MTPSEFWATVERGNADECWPWAGSRNSDGYGMVTFSGRRGGAHRIAWRLVHGDAGKLFVCHRCDNPRCCNPDHMFLGTHAENMRDRDAKGRAASGERHGSRTHAECVPRGDSNGSRRHPERLARGDRNGARLHPERLKRGEDNGRAVLIAADVLEIRRRVIDGALLRPLSREYGVSDFAIRQIVFGRTWKHITGGEIAQRRAERR